MRVRAYNPLENIMCARARACVPLGNIMCLCVRLFAPLENIVFGFEYSLCQSSGWDFKNGG